MKFAEEIQAGSNLLVEGSMFDRLKRLAGNYFDPELAHLGLIYSNDGRSALREAYEGYISQASKSSHPIAIFTPTWRANQYNVGRSRLKDRDVNGDASQFVLELKNLSDSVFVGGLVGCKNDCYSPEQALSSAEAVSFHERQINALASSEVDFLFASTLPAVSEALGLAISMATTEKPYILSFVADGSGRILDGNTILQAIELIDANVPRRPLGYFVNCTHPAVLLAGVNFQGKEFAEKLRGRLIGFQGNTSRRDPREFDSLPQLETEDPNSFAEATIRLRDQLGLQMLGGCCGTCPEHIGAIGKLMKREA